jgi:predicted alpha/beta hydrolase family esterase
LEAGAVVVAGAVVLVAGALVVVVVAGLLVVAGALVVVTGALVVVVVVELPQPVIMKTITNKAAIGIRNLFNETSFCHSRIDIISKRKTCLSRTSKLQRNLEGA